MEVLVVLITLAVITGVGILIFLGVRAIFEFFEEHSVARFILIGLVVVSLASNLGPIVLVVGGGILLFKIICMVGSNIIEYFPNFDSHSYSDPMKVKPKHKGNDEIIDFDIYEDMLGNRYRYNRRYGELTEIGKSYNHIKVSQFYDHDLTLEDSKGNSYDRVN